MSERAGSYQRSASGLIGAMLVLLLALGAFVVLRSIRGNQDTPPPAVPYAGLAVQARHTKVLTAPTPDPMPAHWRATSARYDRGADPTWHLGILTSKQTYVGIEEAAQPAAKLVSTFLAKGADRRGTVNLGGAEWTGWSKGSAYALTRSTGASTVFVGGPAGRDAVLKLAGQLSFG